jgi:hypothetical protein
MRGGFLLLLFCLLAFTGFGQIVMKGTVTDAADGKRLANISVENIYSRLGTFTDTGGNFTITVDRGQLVEFRKLGYKTTRVRIPQGSVPPYFRVIMEKGAFELAEVLVRDRYRDYKTDSLRYREIYKRELEFPELTGLDVIRHPFSALSKTNRRIWAFQKEYNAFEQLKFVDYTFNDRLITNLTGLKGELLQEYRTRYRPSYEMLRAMTEYQFYDYIKRTAKEFAADRYRSSSHDTY